MTAPTPSPEASPQAIEARADLSELALTIEATLARIAALHQPDGHACTCGSTWPCPTARALEDG